MATLMASGGKVSYYPSTKTTAQSAASNSSSTSSPTNANRDLTAESATLGLTGDVKNAYDYGGYQGVVDYYNKLGDSTKANEWTGYRNDYLSGGTPSVSSSNTGSGLTSNHATAGQLGLAGAAADAYNNGGYQGAVDYYNSIGNTTMAQQYANLRQQHVQQYGENPATGATNGTLSSGVSGDAWKTDASASDPYGIRAKDIYSQFGGDTGRAAQYYLAMGDLENAKTALDDREKLGAYGNDGLQLALLNEYYGKYEIDQQKKKAEAEAEEMKRMQEEAYAAEQAAIRAAIDNAVAALEYQKGDVNAAADQSGQAAWVEYMKAQNRFGKQAEQAAKLGSGGSGDFMEVAALNGYQGAQAQISSNKDKLLNDIALAIVQAKNSGDVQLANAIANNAAQQIALTQWSSNTQQNLFSTGLSAAQQYAAAVQAAKDQAYNRDIYADETAYNRSLDQRNYDYQLAQDGLNNNRYNQQTLLDLAGSLLVSGQFRSFDSALAAAKGYLQVA